MLVFNTSVSIFRGSGLLQHPSRYGPRIYIGTNGPYLWWGRRQPNWRSKRWSWTTSRWSIWLWQFQGQRRQKRPFERLRLVRYDSFLGSVHVLVLLNNWVSQRFYSVENLVEKLCWSTKLTHEWYHIVFLWFRTRSGARTITEDPYSIVPEVNSFITNEIINGNRTKCFYQKNLIIKCIFYISNLNSENSILLICDKNEHFWHSLDPQQLFVPHAAPEFKSIEQKIV